MSKIKDVLARAISLASEQPMSYKEAVELLDGIDTCKVKIWLEEGAILPKYAHKEDACMDLFVKDIEIDGGRIIYHTGVHVALPEDYEMEILLILEEIEWLNCLSVEGSVLYGMR